jgi:Protein of unknown function (DUF2975)
MKRMKKQTDYVKMVLLAISWLIFVGVSIEAAGFIVNTIITIFYEPPLGYVYWSGLDLSAVYRHHQGMYVTLTATIAIASVLKAIMFYIILTILHNKNWNLDRPFQAHAGRSIALIAYLALGIGFFCSWGSKVQANIESQGVPVLSLQQLHIAGADVWLFMGVILLVVARIMKKGIDMQLENDLTV